MERKRNILIGGSLVWALIAAAIALTALPDVNPAVRTMVTVLSVALPLAAAVAARHIATSRYRTASALLVLSAATPTYMAGALNLIPIFLAVALIPFWQAPHPSPGR